MKDAENPPPLEAELETEHRVEQVHALNRVKDVMWKTFIEGPGIKLVAIALMMVAVLVFTLNDATVLAVLFVVTLVGACFFHPLFYPFLLTLVLMWYRDFGLTHLFKYG